MGRKKLTLTSRFFRPNNNGGGDHAPSSSSSLSSSLSSSSSWPWPSCKHPRTDSFRRDGQDHNVIYKTVSSVFFDSATADSFFTHSTSEDCYCCCLDIGSHVDDDYSEAVIRRGLAASSDRRLFFEPGGSTSSILKEDEGAMVPFKESVAMAMDSEDPYRDFRWSMEEMVAAHGMKDWDCLEELFVWYLRVNGKKNHGFIVGAFVDLLVALAETETETETESSMEKDVVPHGAVSGSSSCSNSMSSVSFEIEEVEEGSGSC